MSARSTVSEAMSAILEYLSHEPRENRDIFRISGPDITEATGLTPEVVNDAVSLLVDGGYVEVLRMARTHPYRFRVARITPRGIYEAERLRSHTEHSSQPAFEIDRPPVPVGSPFGFTDEDWELVATRKGSAQVLNVVVGYQFQSEFYDSTALLSHLEKQFTLALQAYALGPDAIPATLHFQGLSAGYGEHLFNEIARDIIASDIAVFECSDLNPNVMIEMGVGLTWGVRVLPLKRRDRPRPPSDISGQTWIDYEENGIVHPEADHHTKLCRVVERALLKKRPH